MGSRQKPATEEGLRNIKQLGEQSKEPSWEHYDDEGYGYGQFGEQFSLNDLINLGASEDQIAEYLNISQAAGGGLASIDPYRGTMGGGMNPSGWSPDPTVRSVTGYQHGGISTMDPMGATLGGGMQNMMGAGIMTGGNPMDFNNLRNTNKYYGAF